LEAARLGDTQKMDGFRRLDRLTRTVEEDRDPFADFDATLAHEHTISASLEDPSAGAMMVRYSYNERNVLRSQFGKQKHWPC
jgi:hypothetical protein